MDKLTREQHIYNWKMEGGNYSWAKWAAMHGIPVHNPEFTESLKRVAEQTSLPTFKHKRTKKERS